MGFESGRAELADSGTGETHGLHRDGGFGADETVMRLEQINDSGFFATALSSMYPLS